MRFSREIQQNCQNVLRGTRWAQQETENCSTQAIWRSTKAKMSCRKQEMFCMKAERINIYICIAARNAFPSEENENFSVGKQFPPVVCGLVHRAYPPSPRRAASEPCHAGSVEKEFGRPHRLISLQSAPPESAASLSGEYPAVLRGCRIRGPTGSATRSCHRHRQAASLPSNL